MTRIEALEIYKDRSSKFRNTQSIQWKMNISVWTLLSLMIYQKPKMNFTPNDYEGSFLRLCFIILISLILVVIHFWFCARIQHSLDSDKKIMSKVILELDKNSEVQIGQIEDSNYYTWQWVIIQTTVTAFLASIFCFVA